MNKFFLFFEYKITNGYIMRKALTNDQLFFCNENK